jgi:hypothetical protein
MNESYAVGHGNMAMAFLITHFSLILRWYCYVQPHQRDITNLLAAAVQACHDLVTSILID